jgi:hypothetical protein
MAVARRSRSAVAIAMADDEEQGVQAGPDGAQVMPCSLSTFSSSPVTYAKIRGPSGRICAKCFGELGPRIVLATDDDRRRHLGVSAVSGTEEGTRQHEPTEST